MADHLREYHDASAENSENSTTESLSGTKSWSKASYAGGWAAALPIIVFQSGQTIAYNGISANVISYMTEVLHMSTASAVVNINVWDGSLCFLSVFASCISDSFLGCYWTVFYSTLFYLVGMFVLAFSAFLPSFLSSLCSESSEKCPGAKGSQLAAFFVSLYLVALGAGGQQPCLQALGAFQFDDHDPKEARQKSSFFNWWVFAESTFSVVSVNVFVYVQENISWGLGFGIPSTIMAATFCIYLLRSPTYRQNLPKSNAFSQLRRVAIAACVKRKTYPASSGQHTIPVNPDNAAAAPLLRKHIRLLDNPAVGDEESTKWTGFSNTEVEEGKVLLRLIPIWVSALMYGVVADQSSQLFIKQGKAMDRKIGSSFEIPSAVFQSVAGMTVGVLVPLYDTMFVPLVRKFTGNVRGVSILQRIGIGLVISTVSMIVAALVEMKRLNLVKELSLESEGQATVPMSICWLLPQYVLLGSSCVFAWVGLQEFFYEQMPETLKSLGLAMTMSVVGVGGFSGGFLVSIIDSLSRLDGHHSWFDNNMNSAHFDYFYWMMATLSAVFFCLYVTVAKAFIYAGTGSTADS